MSSSDKCEALESWKKGVVKVMICASMFGMGINQPDVEVVICVGFPPSLEDMVQKFGKAGRDGWPAKVKYMCIWKSYVHLMKISYLTVFQGYYCITSQTCNMPHSGVGVYLNKRCYQHTK